MFTSNDYFYLSSIYYMNSSNVTDLAKKHSVSKPAISLIVRKLMALELIEKLQSEKDRRFFTLQLTDKGKRLMLGDEKVYSIFIHHLCNTT